MPVAQPGLLKKAIENWLYKKFAPEGGPGWFERVRARYKEYQAVYDSLSPNQRNIVNNGAIAGPVQHIVYALFGNPGLIGALRKYTPSTPDVSPSELLGDLIDSVVRDPTLRELTEVFGTLLTEPVLGFLEGYAGKDTDNPKEVFRGLHGVASSTAMFGALLDGAIELVTGFQGESGAVLADGLISSSGLHLLNWSALSPLLDVGVKPGMERYYNRLYHSKRFSAGDLRDLYALGTISQETLKQGALDEGWRAEDIDRWIKLAFRTLTQGDVWKAWHDGLITQDEASVRLRAIGYDPADLPLLFKLNPKEEQDTAKSFTVSTARQGYREHLISETELRAILAGLKYQPAEVNLIVSLENLQRDTEARGLTVSQIKAAWTENVITDPEAVHWLAEAGIGGDEVTIILGTWRAEVVPVYRALNLGTITGAYVEGILTREQATDKLLEIGLRLEDVILELDLVQARNPQAFGAPEPVQKRALTPGNLSDLYTSGTITLDQLRERLASLGYSPEDAALLAEAARVRTLPPERKLPQASIERGFLSSILDRAKAHDGLIAIGYSEASANVILNTIEAENPAIFSTEPQIRYKQLNERVLEDLVLGGLISADEMFQRLLDLGFSEQDAGLLTERAVQLATPPVRILGQSTIERAYIAGILDQTQALEKLLEADFDPEEAATIIATVEAENPAVFNPSLVQVFRSPSISALAAAVKDGIISEDEYRARAAEIGYRPQDVELYLSLSTRQERKATVNLSPSQIINAYGAGFMPWGTALSRLTQKGYGDSDALLLLRMEKDLIENTDVWSQLLTGGIGPFDAISQLISANYADADILQAFTNLGPAALAQMEIDLSVLADVLAETPGGA